MILWKGVNRGPSLQDPSLRSPINCNGAGTVTFSNWRMRRRIRNPNITSTFPRRRFNNATRSSWTQWRISRHACQILPKTSIQRLPAFLSKTSQLWHVPRKHSGYYTRLLHFNILRFLSSAVQRFLSATLACSLRHTIPGCSGSTVLRRAGISQLRHVAFSLLYQVALIQQLCVGQKLRNSGM